MLDEGVKHTWKRKSTGGQVGPRRDRRRGMSSIGKTKSSRDAGNTFISLPLAPLNVQLAKGRDRKHLEFWDHR